MRLILINGAKNSKKEIVAMRLSKNSDCIWIKPYTDSKLLFDDNPHLNKEQLSRKMEREVPLCETVVNNHRYVFFENQLNAEYVVLIGDDRILDYLKNNYSGDMITVKVHSKDEEYSARNLLPDKWFDIVFNVDTDDIDELEELVGDIYHYQEGHV